MGAPFLRECDGTIICSDLAAASCFVLSTAASDGGDEHDLIPILEGVGVAAQEADVFVVDVDVDELSQLAVLVFDLRGQSGEGLVQFSEQRGQVCGVRVELLAAIGVAGEGGGKDYLDGHRSTLLLVCGTKTGNNRGEMRGFFPLPFDCAQGQNDDLYFYSSKQ